jgi:outer membrane receptor for ferrienterochelin and colicins
MSAPSTEAQPSLSRSPARTRGRVTPRPGAFGLALSLIAALARADVPPDRQTVVVTGTRSEKTIDDTPVRTEVVTRAEIVRTNARTLKEALENVPGLQIDPVHGKSGFEVSLQGLTGDQVLVLVDGLPITASTGSTMDLSQYLLTDVDRIEIVKGAASAQYGSSAMGGVINVITRRIPSGLAAAATVDAGSRGDENVSGGDAHPAVRHGQARVEGGTPALRWRLAGDLLDDEGFAKPPDAWARQGDAQRRGQFAGRLDWQPAPEGEFWLGGSRYREDDEQRYDYFVPPNHVAQRRTEVDTRDRIDAGGQWSWANGLRAQLKGVDERYDSVSDEYSDQALVTTRNAAQRMDHVSAQVDLPAWAGQSWQVGADGHHERLAQDNNGATELAGGRVARTNNELYALDDIALGKAWELVAGLRWQDDSDFGTHAAPKLALRGTLLAGGDWSAAVRASAGQGYRVPNLTERHYLFDHSALGYKVIGNPDLQPESSNSFQLGGTLAWRRRMTLEVNAYFNRVKDLIQTDLADATIVNGIAIYTYRNVSQARTAGIETALKWSATASLDLSAAYTFDRTRDLSTGTDLTQRPRHMGRVGIDWDVVEGTQLTLRGRAQGSSLADSATRARSPGWATLDLKLGRKLAHGFTAFAGVDNVFDRQRNFANVDDAGPVEGRYAYLGLSVALGDQH